MFRSPRTWLAAFLLGSGYLLCGAANAPAQDKDPQVPEGGKLLSKAEALTAADEKDTKQANSHRKIVW